MKKQALPALTGIRFLAALAVLCHHYFGWVVRVPWWVQRVALLGGAGVSLFFVLSGFILTWNYRADFADGVRWSKFASLVHHRFARVYPMHLVALMAITQITLYVARPARPLGAGVTVTAWPAQAALLNGWVPDSRFFDLYNAPSWSIGADALFYLCFPFFVARFVRRSWGRRGLLALMLGLYAVEVALFVAAGLLVRRLVRHGLPHEAMFLFAGRQPLARMWKFFIGCAVVRGLPFPPDGPPRRPDGQRRRRGVARFPGGAGVRRPEAGTGSEYLDVA